MVLEGSAVKGGYCYGLAARQVAHKASTLLPVLTSAWPARFDDTMRSGGAIKLRCSKVKQVHALCCSSPLCPALPTTRPSLRSPQPSFLWLFPFRLLDYDSVVFAFIRSLSPVVHDSLRVEKFSRLTIAPGLPDYTCRKSYISM